MVPRYREERLIPDAGGRFGGTSSGFVNLASSLSATLAPLTAAGFARAFGSFHAVFYAAAGLYVLGAMLWLIIDPSQVPAPVKE